MFQLGSQTYVGEEKQRMVEKKEENMMGRTVEGVAEYRQLDRRERPTRPCRSLSSCRVEVHTVTNAHAHDCSHAQTATVQGCRVPLTR